VTLLQRQRDCFPGCLDLNQHLLNAIPHSEGGPALRSWWLVSPDPLANLSLARQPMLPFSLILEAPQKRLPCKKLPLTSCIVCLPSEIERFHTTPVHAMSLRLCS
jgi:hypothetical protein